MAKHVLTPEQRRKRHAQAEANWHRRNPNYIRNWRKHHPQKVRRYNHNYTYCQH